MAFTEKSPIEAGFAAVYNERIAPKLDALEAERLNHTATAGKWRNIGFGVALVVLAAVGLLSGNWVAAVIAALVVAAIGAMVSYSSQSGSWKEKIYGTVMPPVCDFLGDCSYDRKASAGFSTSRMRDLKMLPGYNQSAFSDRIEGTYRDTAFEMVEAHLMRTQGSGSDRKTTTLFRGLLFRIGMPMTAPTPIVVLRDRGGVGNRLASMFTGEKGRGMPKVDVDHPGFEEVFEVHAEDPAAARAFLPPLFLDNLLTIAREEGGSKGEDGMRAGFDESDFYLALDRREPFLEFGGMGSTVYEIEPQLHEVFDDMALVRRIIDRLHGDAASR
ncbi:DUF3137 domain-containing protein [Pelagovum pacificum]|uniref:DUF3137 domain-containing protein n=1 Tax=Pelagovum pacificum TaxID=2588711 RepID=A0A5C5GGM4_9RHOB|nr:DUF3137 domain-containing protein [Pelagovum pacificum]QQA42958.1 DUF3137 domain-containing protein [Pelagovum pacificum]TNY33898.1 DUF3137 domain-containing protein [Pelagovum pacificum]